MTTKQDKAARDQTETKQTDPNQMTKDELDQWRMSKDDRRWGDDDDEGGHTLKSQKFEVYGGRYFLDGQEIDFTEPVSDRKEGDEYSIQQSIRLYRPNEGIFWWHPEHGTFSPVASSRAGSGDTGVKTGNVPIKTVTPEDNSPERMKESDTHLQTDKRTQTTRR